MVLIYVTLILSVVDAELPFASKAVIVITRLPAPSLSFVHVQVRRSELTLADPALKLFEPLECSVYSVELPLKL